MLGTGERAALILGPLWLAVPCWTDLRLQTPCFVERLFLWALFFQVAVLFLLSRDPPAIRPCKQISCLSPAMGAHAHLFAHRC